MHDIDLILTLTAGLGAALVLGFLALRLRLPPIVGYLLAGLIIGPYTPGYVANRELANQLAEVGVILLMFAVGLHFHLEDLLAVRRIAVAGALFQIMCATVLGAVGGHFFGWSPAAGWIYGLALSVASTVVLTRVLADSGDLQSPAGRVAIGWLVVEDIFTVFALVVMPAVFGKASAGGSGLGLALGLAAVKMAALGVLTLWGGGRVLPRVLGAAAATRSRELFTLTVLAIALGIAVGSAALFGVSMALGAFLAGMVVGRSDFSFRAASEALPMRDAFAVLFFVSVGMLFDPQHVLRQPLQVAVTTAIVVLAKPAAALAIVLVLGRGARIGLRVAASLAQIGEFSFIVASLGGHLKLLPEEATHSLVAASIATIALNPLLYRLASAAADRMGKGAPPEAEPEAEETGEDRSEDPTHRAVVVGYGPVGRHICGLLAANSIACTVVELNAATIPRIREDGYRAVHGDAAREDTLREAGVERARVLILSTPDSPESTGIIREARALNADIGVLARAAFLARAEELRQAGADEVFAAEAEVAIAMRSRILAELGATPEQIDGERQKARDGLYRRAAN
jgi:CPA2 family monovalent cation:H+ antiporter-2